MKCNHCGALAPVGAAFCDTCGRPLQPPGSPAAPTPGQCPTCGTINVPGAMFCEQCGAPMEPDKLAARARVALIGRLVIQPDGSSLPLPAHKTEALLGREDPVSNNFPEIDLTPLGGHENGVSRRHARLFIQDGRMFIEDLNSVNHTFLNRRKVPPGQPTPVDDGDEIRLGRMILMYYSS